MRRWRRVLGVLGIAAMAFGAGAYVVTAQQDVPTDEQLMVLWRSGDPEMFHQACYLFTLNAKRFKWFEEVTLVVWGPSQKLLMEDEAIQAEIEKMQKAGVWVVAEIDTAIAYDIEQDLRKRVNVAMMSQRLVEHLKRGGRLLTI